jgi:hypothetical protein
MVRCQFPPGREHDRRGVIGHERGPQKDPPDVNVVSDIVARGRLDRDPELAHKQIDGHSSLLLSDSLERSQPDLQLRCAGTITPQPLRITAVPIDDAACGVVYEAG